MDFAVSGRLVLHAISLGPGLIGIMQPDHDPFVTIAQHHPLPSSATICRMMAVSFEMIQKHVCLEQTDGNNATQPVLHRPA